MTTPGGDDDGYHADEHDDRHDEHRDHSVTRVEHLRDIHHVSEFDRLEIQPFFEVYKDLEPGKSVEGADWVGRTEAEAEIEASRKRLEAQGGKH